jgi:hypothetical protein
VSKTALAPPPARLARGSNALFVRWSAPIEKLFLSLFFAHSIRMDVHIGFESGTFGFPVSSRTSGGFAHVAGIFRQRLSRTLQWPLRFVIPPC